MLLMRRGPKGQKHLAACFILLAVAGCAKYETVYLKNPSTGQTAQCGPYNLQGYDGQAMAIAMRGCAEDYQRQGYIRVEKPS